jgi:hypothetical protein
MGLGSGIPDPGVKKAPDPGSRIPDPDPQHRLHVKVIADRFAC